ncbi:hypothetical protein FD724_26140 [Nostoc sp. C057]|nr:hypothetical protein FD724_26140 [Nostoc sp. C057]
MGIGNWALGIGKRIWGQGERLVSSSHLLSPYPLVPCFPCPLPPLLPHPSILNIFLILVAVIAKVKGKRENFYF